VNLANVAARTVACGPYAYGQPPSPAPADEYPLVEIVAVMVSIEADGVTGEDAIRRRSLRDPIDQLFAQ
jgi:hypothetical protein